MALTPSQIRRRKLNMLMAMSYAAYASTKAQFTPAQLFASGEVGAWFDPSDFSTMFQDSAGTTPVTAVEQPVGLILDKSKGLVLGSELVTNGDFSNGTTGWTGVNSATLSVVDGKLRVTGTGVANPVGSQAVTTVAGRWYKVTADFTSIGGVTANMWVGTVAGGSSLLNTTMATSGSFQFAFLATGTTSYIGLKLNTSAAVSSDFDNISVRELPGNHASQSTSASRPVLSARYNLLTQTENFSNAAWTKSNATVASSAVTAPDGVSTMTKLLPNSGTGTNRFISQSGIGNKMVVFAKADELTWLMLYSGIANSNAWFDLENGVEGSKSSDVVSASIDDVGNDIYRCTVVWTTLSSTPRIYATSANGSLSVITTGTEGIYIWGADLRVTNDGVGLPAYQRVGAATDYDTTGFPLYLKFDGTDDSLATSSIDFSSTDKMTIVSGVRKANDTASQIIAELSANWTTNAGSILYACSADANGTAGAFFRSGAAGAPAGSFGYAGLVSTASGYAAPISAVFTALHDISGDNSTVRVNGTAATASTTDKGTGNFGNLPLYIGARSGPSSMFNGRIYSLIGLGRTATDAEITNTEAWVNSKTRAY